MKHQPRIKFRKETRRASPNKFNNKKHINHLLKQRMKPEVSQEQSKESVFQKTLNDLARNPLWHIAMFLLGWSMMDVIREYFLK